MSPTYEFQPLFGEASPHDEAVLYLVERDLMPSMQLYEQLFIPKDPAVRAEVERLDTKEWRERAAWKRSLVLEIGDLVEDEFGHRYVVASPHRFTDKGERARFIGCVMFLDDGRLAEGLLSLLAIRRVVERGAYSEGDARERYTKAQGEPNLSFRLEGVPIRVVKHDPPAPTPPAISDRDWDPTNYQKLYDERPEETWRLVANVVGAHPFGKDRKTVSGTRHFSGGTKVYCMKSFWGDGYENIPVLGKPRGKWGLRCVVMNRRFLENFRLKRLYSPSVIERIFAVYRDDYHGQAYNPWDDSDEDRQEIESLLPWLNETARQQREAWDAEMAAVHDACGHALCAAPDKDVPETAIDAEVDRVLGKAHGEFGPSASDSGWVPCDGGKTLGTRGSENGLILIDEEHPEGARITLEQCDRHCAVTCGILGGMVHTSFCDKDRVVGTRHYLAMRQDIEGFITSDYTDDEMFDFFERFRNKWL